jgi:hypothetical protein
VFLPHKEKRKQADILTPEADFLKTKEEKKFPGVCQICPRSFTFKHQHFAKWKLAASQMHPDTAR